jgi:N-acyl-D-amino-acid deacylase
MNKSVFSFFLTTLCFLAHAEGPHGADIVLRGGLVFDGLLNPGEIQDVAISNDRITFIGDASNISSGLDIDVSGLAVTPGFINTLSWATESLLLDGRSQGDIRQGVTLEVFGEGTSMGPLNNTLRQVLKSRQGDVKYDIPWSTLGEYLQHLETSGISTNVASFVGATTVRTYVLGYNDRAPTLAELETMKDLVAQAMREGALGVGSSLIYAPGSFANTAELEALVGTAQEFGGMYISHMRSEGDRLLSSVDELISIAKNTGAAAEIYHLKVAGKENWHKFPALIEKIEAARAVGLKVSANMYTYTAGSTGLDAAMPTWAQAGGVSAWIARLKDPQTRNQIATEMVAPTSDWENLLRQAGPEGTLLVGFKNLALRKYIGQTLAQVAEQRQTTAHEAAMDLVVEDGSRVQAIYFLMSDDNVRRTIALPWVSFGSDAGSYTASGHFLAQGTHPRAYGNFARVLGKYSRDEGILSLPEAIHRLAYLPAKRFKLPNRGALKPGYFADIAIFDPKSITDKATYQDPHRYAVGMIHVLVNGKFVLLEGEHTGNMPGRVVRGPGWQGWSQEAKLSE